MRVQNLLINIEYLPSAAKENIFFYSIQVFPLANILFDLANMLNTVIKFQQRRCNSIVKSHLAANF
jgi:hypothetical protein